MKLYQIIANDPERVGKWMYARNAGMYREGSACIGLTRKGELVAGAMFDYYNGASIFANIAIDGFITKEWLREICRYPFVQLGCNVIIALISGDNLKSQKFVANFGFRPIAPIPKADPSGSLGIYALYREDCRFVKGPIHGKV